MDIQVFDENGKTLDIADVISRLKFKLGERWENCRTFLKQESNRKMMKIHVFVGTFELLII